MKIVTPVLLQLIAVVSLLAADGESFAAFEIADPALHFEFARCSLRKVAESDALHTAAHFQMNASDTGRKFLLHRRLRRDRVLR